MKIDKILLFGTGFIVGILLAPKKGDETITDIKKLTVKKTKCLKDKLGTIKSNLESDIDEIEESFYTKTENNFVELKTENKQRVGEDS